MLNSAEPVCISVVPKSYTDGITVAYVSSGMNEDQITFTAIQDGVSLYSASGKSNDNVLLSNRGNKNVNLCWSKIDRKAKKINFIISQPEKQMDAKATTDTVEGL